MPASPFPFCLCLQSFHSYDQIYGMSDLILTLLYSILYLDETTTSLNIHYKKTIILFPKPIAHHPTLGAFYLTTSLVIKQNQKKTVSFAYPPTTNFSIANSRQGFIDLNSYFKLSNSQSLNWNKFHPLKFLIITFQNRYGLVQPWLGLLYWKESLRSRALRLKWLMIIFITGALWDGRFILEWGKPSRLRARFKSSMFAHMPAHEPIFECIEFYSLSRL